tara:strand:- start:801 stop:1223 length:423 start_codon:yes stop_codon:yes gene_type:complete
MFIKGNSIENSQLNLVKHVIQHQASSKSHLSTMIKPDGYWKENTVRSNVMIVMFQPEKDLKNLPEKEWESIFSKSIKSMNAIFVMPIFINPLEVRIVHNVTLLVDGTVAAVLAVVFMRNQCSLELTTSYHVINAILMGEG